MVELVPAKLTHVGPIATRMREIDKLECAISGHSAKQALRLGVILSTLCWTVLVAGRPEGMLGVVTSSLLDRSGRIWLLMTEECAAQRRALIRLPAVVLPAIHNHYSILHNKVHASNLTAIRWLEFLGFEVGPEELFKGEPMKDFRRCVAQQHLS